MERHTLNKNIFRVICISLIMIFMSISLGCGSTKKTKAELISLMAPENHGLSTGEFSVEPGMSETRGNVQISCPAGGSACTVTIAADGSVSYNTSGGQPTIMLATELLTLPANHGLTAGEISVQPGMSETRGNVDISCPAGGSICTITITDDGTASYIAAGGQPTIMPATESLTLPANHGLTAGEISVQPGMSETRGNVDISCPAGGSICTITITDDGTASYIAAGGQPTIMPATESLTLPTNHGLTAGEISVQPGMSETRGNVDISCPAGGSICTITITDDGTASYIAAGGQPTIMPATESLTLPANHGLTAGEISVQPGMSETRGNVDISCPPGGSVCTITITDDGTASYIAAGGQPTIMPATESLTLPANHGLTAGEISVQPGMSETRGNVDISCPPGGSICTITITNDGTASYIAAGGQPTVTPLPDRQIALGLSKSLSEPVYSNNANDISFDQSISNSQNIFAPITTALDRISGDPSTVASSDAAIKTFSSDGDGGYYVTFVVDDVEWTQHYTRENHVTEDGVFESMPEDNAPYWNNIWYENTGFTYFNVYAGVSGSLEPGVRPRFFFVAGVRTENLPTATAKYVGGMTGQIWRNANLSDMTRVRGTGFLTANFGQSTVTGEISRIEVRPETSGSYSILANNRFIVENGNIENSQFLLNLRGADSTSGLGDAQNSNEEIASIKGFDGNILGEFFGPQANEVGAVLNATRGDAVLIGYLGGRSPFNPTGPIEQANSAPINATVKRDFTSGSSSIEQSDESTRVESITSDGEGEIILTYLVDGTQYTVEFDDSNVDMHLNYNKNSNNREQWLWTISNGFTIPDFNHFNSYYFTSSESGGNIWPISIFVHGLQTDADNLPSEPATYLGRAWIDSWENCCVGYSARQSTKGNLSLTADFGESTISGLIDEIEHRFHSRNSFESFPDASAVISEGTIDGNLFNANLQGTGSIGGVSGQLSGAFYGPAAQEVGGVIKSTTTDSVGVGWFGGSRETQ